MRNKNIKFLVIKIIEKKIKKKTWQYQNSANKSGFIHLDFSLNRFLFTNRSKSEKNKSKFTSPCRQLQFVFHFKTCPIILKLLIRKSHTKCEHIFFVQFSFYFNDFITKPKRDQSHNKNKSLSRFGNVFDIMLAIKCDFAQLLCFRNVFHR